MGHSHRVGESGNLIIPMDYTPEQDEQSHVGEILSCFDPGDDGIVGASCV